MDLERKIEEFPDWGLEEAIRNVQSAKDEILRNLIEKIEGRAAILSDADNLTLISYQIDISFLIITKQQVIYKGVTLGDIEISMRDMVVRFIPYQVD